MRIEFTVQGYPPKKEGAKSMWQKDSEVQRIIDMRKEAFAAMQQIGLNGCIQTSVKLEVTIYAPSHQFIRGSGYYMGDLDTLLAGIFDALQAAHSNTPIAHALFQSSQVPQIHPRNNLLLNDDAQIMSVVAKRVSLNQGQQAFYEVALETI